MIRAIISIFNRIIKIECKIIVKTRSLIIEYIENQNIIVMYL